MEKRIGTFYGVSVGPGDPELMTLQAVRCLENCPVIAAPQTPKGGMLALDIAKGAVDLSGKTILPLRFAMSLDPAVQKAAHIEAARAVKEYLDAGQDVAMLNLGDVSVYATFGYLQEILEAEGCKTVMLPGVTSFCAAAARLGQSLTGGMEQPLTIAPGRCAAEVLAAPGAKVLMKSGRQLPETLAALADAGLLSRSAMVCNCGLPNEEVWPDLTDYDPARSAGYFATILVKEGEDMVHFVGAGPGAPDLITRRGAALLADADCIIYAGSLVNPALLGLAKPGCAIYNSAEMTLEQVLDTIRATEKAGGTTVRLHTGDPCLYGAIREQMDALDADGIPYDDTPGVSSFCGAAAALCAEYTLPNVSQTVIITRMEGRTPVPEAEQLAKLAAHGATMVIFLSIGLVDKVRQALLESGGYRPDTPAAVVYKATWPEQKVVRCTVSTLTEETRKNGITKTALIVVGDFLGENYERSKLYDPAFTTEFRQGTEAGQ